MNAQQKQAMSWSDFHDQLFANLTPKQKELFHKKNYDVYDLYKSGMTAKETISYIIGGCL